MKNAPTTYPLLGLLLVLAACSSGRKSNDDLRASFSAAPTSGDPPLLVHFTDTSTGDITEWFWEFGDGETSAERNPEHLYASLGSFTPRLTVRGPSGSRTQEGQGMIQVGNGEHCLAGSWSVSGVFTTPDLCEEVTGLESQTIELVFCDPCELDAGSDLDAYDVLAPYTEGSLAALYLEVPVPTFPRFSITGEYYLASLDRTFELSATFGDTGDADCDSFSSSVSCNIYFGNALVDGPDGLDIGPDALFVCSGRLELSGTRSALGSLAGSTRRALWHASDGIDRQALLVLGDVVQVFLDWGPTVVVAEGVLRPDGVFDARIVEAGHGLSGQIQGLVEDGNLVYGNVLVEAQSGGGVRFLTGNLEL